MSERIDRAAVEARADDAALHWGRSTYGDGVWAEPENVCRIAASAADVPALLAELRRVEAEHQSAITGVEVERDAYRVDNERLRDAVSRLRALSQALVDAMRCRRCEEVAAEVDSEGSLWCEDHARSYAEGSAHDLPHAPALRALLAAIDGGEDGAK